MMRLSLDACRHLVQCLTHSNYSKMITTYIIIIIIIIEKRVLDPSQEQCSPYLPKKKKSSPKKKPAPDTASPNHTTGSEDKKTIHPPSFARCEETDLLCSWGPTHLGLWRLGLEESSPRREKAHLPIPLTCHCPTPPQSLLPSLSPIPAFQGSLFCTKLLR